LSIRLLHFSDAHVGVEAYGHFDPATGLNSRLIDFTRTLDAVVDAAIARDVDLVLFTGDAYRTRDPSPTQQREFAARIRRLSESGIPVFLLVGNHDRPNSYGRAHAVDIFRTLGVPHVTVGATPETVIVTTRRGPVQVTALPWLPRSYALSKESIQKLSPEEAQGEMLAKIIGFLQQEARSIDRDIPAVLAAHVAVEGATYSAGAAVLAGSELTVPRSQIAGEAWDYVALGHIHKHQVATVLPPAVYAGSIERVDFGEQDDPKGYVLVELGAEGTTWQFVELPARRFVTVKVDARDGDATELTLAAVERSGVADAIVRVQVRVSDVKARVDRAAIRQALRPAYAFAGLAMLVDERDDPSTLREEALPHLPPVEALRLYLETVKPTPTERRDRLCDRARTLLQEATAGALEVAG
jgi:DNA repair protein SbcD/Mre11